MDNQMSPKDLSRKWGCSFDRIRQWVKEAGKVLPKTYKKRKLPEDVKLLDDPAFKSQKPDSTDNGGLGANKKALRGVRLPSKNKKRNNNDEPVCIALSDSEEDGDEEMGDTETIEDDDSGRQF